MSAPKKINWEKARAEYVANREMSLKALAKKYGVSYGHVQNLSAKEGWVKDKEERWAEQEKQALEEVEGSIKDLIVRHAKVARFLQAGGIKRLQKRFKELDAKDANPKLARQIREMDDRTLIACVSEGLKAERELYPKQMQIEGDVDLTVKEASEELKRAANEALKKQLRSKRRPSKRSNRN